MKKKALITGITGQDGSYLAELLLSKGYKVHGLVRRIAYEDEATRYSRIAHILNKLIIHRGDVGHMPTIWSLVAKIMPDEIYHLAAQSQVHVSYEDDIGTFKSNLDSTIHLLKTIKKLKPNCKFYFAGTSEMFGKTNSNDIPQNERTKFNPISPYAISKVAAYHSVKMYRDAYNIFACTGILFNHESPRRGFEFVTRKITSTAVKIKLGKQKVLKLGNLDALRDWGYANDYVEAMWLMLQQKKPEDFVIGTGKHYTIKDFVKMTFQHPLINLNWKKFVKYNNKADIRPLDVNILRANPYKATDKLGWKSKVNIKELVHMMVTNDFNLLK